MEINMEVYLILRYAIDSRRMEGYRTMTRKGTKFHAEVLQLSDHCFIENTWYNVVLREHDFDKGKLRITLQKFNIK